MLLPKWLDNHVKRFLASKGYVTFRGGRDAGAIARRATLLASNKVDLVLDVGANTGQYGKCLRDLGYTGRIHSFEPMTAACRTLRDAISTDPLWDASQIALGDHVGSATIHIAGNSVSSSLLEMLPAHERSSPGSRFVGEETVKVSTLDRELPSIRGEASSVLLKLDVQGFESRVLAGATQSLAHISLIQIELSLAELYGDQLTYLDMCLALKELGFELIGIEPGFTDSRTGVLLQFDGIFRRTGDSGST
jgi:FkbM family methyltransferase